MAARAREPQRMLRLRCFELDISIKATHERLAADGETLKLVRFYEIISGYKVATQAEQEMLARKLQCPAWMLFNREGGAN